MGIITIDLDLLHDGEAHTIVSLAGLDFLWAARLLGPKLIAREAQNHEAFVLVL